MTCQQASTTVARYCAREKAPGPRSSAEVAMDWWGWVILAVVVLLILITLAVLVQARAAQAAVIGDDHTHAGPRAAGQRSDRAPSGHAQWRTRRRGQRRGIRAHRWSYRRFHPAKSRTVQPVPQGFAALGRSARVRPGR